MLLGKETKAATKHVFGELFARFTKGSMVIPAVKDFCPELSSFIIGVPSDKSSIWKFTLRGGACGKTHHPCPYCNAHIDFLCLYVLGEDRCQICLDEDCSRCCCKPVCDREHLRTIMDELMKYCRETWGEGFRRLEEIKRQLEMLTDPTQVDADENPKHIDYTGTNKKKAKV